MRARPSRGLSIVELMIGITISLFILAAATMISTSQLGDNRRLLLDAQVQQDIRIVTEMVTRELRRAGYWGKAAYAVWPATAASAVNPYDSFTPTSAAAATEIEFRRSRDEDFGEFFYSEKNDPDTNTNKVKFVYDANTYTIKTILGDGNMEAMNDPSVLEITDFQVRVDTVDVDVPCGATCPDPPKGVKCPLKLGMRNATVTLVGRSASDHSVVRSVSYNVRLRNDFVHEAAC